MQYGNCEVSDELLRAFVAESNRIEGILEVRPHEIEAHEELLSLDVITVDDVCKFVEDVANARLRDKPRMNVIVGGHYRPPPGGPMIVDELEHILNWVSHSKCSAYQLHHAYETLHPFTDGNGRSGRAIWAWQMVRQSTWGLNLGFLHAWYYQSLQASR